MNSPALDAFRPYLMVVPNMDATYRDLAAEFDVIQTDVRGGVELHYITGLMERGERQANGCLLWTGARSSAGYGYVSREGVEWRVHRLIYELLHGPIAPGSFILHTCDTRACFEPSHLVAGDHAENMRQMVQRDRAATGDRNAARLYPERKPRGEQHPNAKLTADQVRAIRAEYVPFKVTQRILADRYGISLAQVQNILKGRQWRGHLSMSVSDDLAAPFDHVFHDTRGGVELSYVSGEQVTSRLNEVLGVSGWSFRVIEHGINPEADEAWALGELVAEMDGRTVLRQQFGSQKLKRSRSTGTPLDLGFDLKGSATDSLKKCASLLGVGLYLSRKEAPPSRTRQPVRPPAAPTGPKPITCARCGKDLEPATIAGTDYNPIALANLGLKHHKRALCAGCFVAAEALTPPKGTIST